MNAAVRPGRWVVELSPTMQEVWVQFQFVSGRVSTMKLVTNHPCASHRCDNPKPGAAKKAVNAALVLINRHFQMLTVSMSKARNRKDVIGVRYETSSYLSKWEWKTSFLFSLKPARCSLQPQRACNDVALPNVDWYVWKEKKHTKKRLYPQCESVHEDTFCQKVSSLEYTCC